MSRRKDQRHFLALPAFAFGNDAEGHSFREPVCTLDVSAQGIRISHIHQKLTIGQEITLEYKKYKIRFRVAWLGKAGTPSKGQIGLHAIDPMKRIPELEGLFGHGPYVDTWKPDGKAARNANPPASTPPVVPEPALAHKA